MALTRKFQLLYLFAALGALLIGLFPSEDWLKLYLDPSMVATYDWPPVRAAFLLAGVCLATYAVFVRKAAVASPNTLWLHLLSGLLIVNLSCTIVQVYQYVSMRVPSTWTEESIHLNATESDGLVSLYTRSSLETPPLRNPVYPPFYYLMIKLGYSVFGASIAVGRCISTGALLTLAILLAVASPRRPAGASILAPFLFLAVFPTVSWGHGSLCKPEHAAAALGLAGLVVYIKRGRHEHSRWVLISSMFLRPGPANKTYRVRLPYRHQPPSPLAATL